MMVTTLNISLILWLALLPLSRAVAGGMPPIKTVFVILMENEDWPDILNQPSAPYINGTLLPMSSYCANYFSPSNLHPSEPNYLWLEAGTNFGIVDDSDPFVNHQNSTNHLVTLLNNAGISWKAYQEDIPGDVVPLGYVANYAPRHNPFVYFDDVTGTNNPNNAYGIAHIRPYTELASDLANNKTARYNFITPNLCNDMHDTCAPLTNNLLQGDIWLSTEIPRIINSQAFKDNGALFITWDENETDFDSIGMIVLSPLAKGGGYVSSVLHTHSSALRTFQEIFGVTPFLGDAANANNLSELFLPQPTFSGFGISSLIKTPGGLAQLTVIGTSPGTTNLVQFSTDLITWTSLSTNVPGTNTFSVMDTNTAATTQRFYRAVQLP